MAKRQISLEREDGAPVCERCLIARTSLARMRGLLGRRELARDEGLLLEPASSIHTGLMRFPIDVVFLSRDLDVLSIRQDVRPWRAVARRGARCALELPAGKSARVGLEVGMRLVACPHQA